MALQNLSTVNCKLCKENICVFNKLGSAEQCCFRRHFFGDGFKSVSVDQCGDIVLCDTCRNQLSLVLELEGKIQELNKEIEIAISNLKARATSGINQAEEKRFQEIVFSERFGNDTVRVKVEETEDATSVRGSLKTLFVKVSKEDKQAADHFLIQAPSPRLSPAPSAPASPAPSAPPSPAPSDDCYSSEENALESPRKSSPKQSNHNDLDNDPDLTFNLLNTSEVISEPDGSVTFCNYSFKALPSGRYRCRSCSRELSHVSQRHLTTHLIKLHTRLLSCSKCSFRAGVENTLQKHIRAKHPAPKKIRLANCPICGRPITPHFKLLEHLWSHKNAAEREEAITSKGQIRVPQRILDKVAQVRFPCDQCPYQATRKTHLKSHKESFHSEGADNKRICEECGGQFRDLKSHMMNVHKTGFPCNQFKSDGSKCERTFASLAALKQHKQLTHFKLKLVQCHLCPRQFGNQTILKQHLLSHSQLREFRCDLCGLGFNVKGQLAEHNKKWHTEGAPARKRKPFSKNPWTKRQKPVYDLGERKFHCEACNVKFSRKAHLERHNGYYHTEGKEPPKRKSFNKSKIILNSE